MGFNTQRLVMSRPFDIETHKKTFTNYLEVIVLEDGTIVYAVPSHQMKLMELACERLRITKEELADRCPPEMYGDYNAWLCKISRSVALYNVGMTGVANQKQKEVIQELKDNGLYSGKIIEKEVEPNFIMKELLGL
jgi:hypothetical protein